MPATGAAMLRLSSQAMARAARALTTPRQVARFLCGLSSPATTRARLTRHRLFGALADVPFPTVLELAETQQKAWELMNH